MIVDIKNNTLRRVLLVIAIPYWIIGQLATEGIFGLNECFGGFCKDIKKYWKYPIKRR